MWYGPEAIVNPLRSILTEIQFDNLSAALAVLTSMITPALLISASGTFILSTSTRLGRVIDRVRSISDRFEEFMHDPSKQEQFEEHREILFEQMGLLSKRAQILQRALTVLYIASGAFIATSVAIGVVSIFRLSSTWLPVALGVGGACLLFYACVLLILEARMAIGVLNTEMAFLIRLVTTHNRVILQQGGSETAHAHIAGSDSDRLQG